MQKDKIMKIGISSLMIVALAISTFAFAFPTITPLQTPYEDWRFPRLDTVNIVEAYPRAVGMEKARASDIDNFVGAIVAADVTELETVYFWSVSSVPGYHMCYHGINTRDVTPDTSGKYFSYYGRTPGFPLYPLNISQFRMALELIIGCEKDAWIADIYSFVNVRLDTNVPPANAYWYNPYIAPYPEDWGKAAALLYAAGFTGTPGVDDWIMPNGTPLRDRWASGDGSVKGILVMPPGDALAPTSHEISRRCVRKWNLFFMGAEQDVGIFIDDPQDTFDPLIDGPFCNRDHDIYFLCWGLGRDPNSLYYFFHSDEDVECGNNSPGLKHDGLDNLLYAMQFWIVKDWEMLFKNIGEYDPDYTITTCTNFDIDITGNPGAVIDEVYVERVSQSDGVYDEVLVLGVDYNIAFPNPNTIRIHIKNPIILNIGDALEVSFLPGTYKRTVTDVDEMQNFVWLLQWKLYYLVPYLPVYSRNYINLYKPGLTGWVEIGGYGSEPSGLPWTFASLHWAGTPIGGSINWHNAGDVTTLNPIKTRWVYEANVEGRYIEGLYNIHPYTQENIPWAALDWEMIPWSDTSLGVEDGMILQIRLRNDVRWQDGKLVKAGDIKWNYDFIKSIAAPEYAIILSTYVASNVVDDYTINILISSTGLWLAQTYLGTALTYPKAVWQPFWGDYAGAVAFRPWSVTYQAHTGQAPTGSITDLTALYGIGSYYLDFWNEVDIAALNANPDYWASCPVVTAVNAPERVLPGQSADYYVLAQSVDTFYQRTVDIDIYVDDVLVNTLTSVTLDPIDYTMLGPYNTGNLAAGTHTIRLEHTEPGTGLSFTYTHTIKSTIVADVNADLIVDIFDVVIVGGSFGAIPTDSNWDARADAVPDLLIDIFDLVTVAGQFGWEP